MLSPDRIETALAASWPALETVTDGRWEARFAGGYSGRSNSIQVFDPADDSDPEARIARLAGLYRAQNLDPLFKVTPLTGAATRAVVAGLGWALYHDSFVLAAEPDPTLSAPEGIAIVAPTSASWRDAQALLQGYGAETRAILADLVALLPAPNAGFIRTAPDGRPLASALCVVAQGVAVPLNVIVAPEARGQGHGRAIMEAVLAWSAAQSPDALAIQVLRDNAPAVALYQSLGFSYLYSYHYRRGSCS